MWLATDKNKKMLSLKLKEIWQLELVRHGCETHKNVYFYIVGTSHGCKLQHYKNEGYVLIKKRVESY